MASTFQTYVVNYIYNLSHVFSDEGLGISPPLKLNPIHAIVATVKCTK